MSTRVAMLLALGLALGAAPGMAAGKAAAKAAEKPKGPVKSNINIDGHIQSTDKKKNLVTIKTSAGAMVTIKIERETKVIRGSKEDLDILALKNGKRVKAKYDTLANGKNVADWILIVPENLGKGTPGGKGKETKGAKKGGAKTPSSTQPVKEEPAP